MEADTSNDNPNQVNLGNKNVLTVENIQRIAKFEDSILLDEEYEKYCLIEKGKSTCAPVKCYSIFKRRKDARYVIFTYYCHEEHLLPSLYTIHLVSPCFSHSQKMLSKHLLTYQLYIYTYFFLSIVLIAELDKAIVDFKTKYANKNENPFHRMQVGFEYEDTKELQLELKNKTTSYAIRSQIRFGMPYATYLNEDDRRNEQIKLHYKPYLRSLERKHWISIPS